MAAKLKKSGVAVLIGRSNAGKSTLMNALVGTKLAITTPKPQTTRNVIHGVIHDPRGQIVLVDTPGIFAQVPDHLTAKLNEKARDALDGVDVVLYIADPTRHIGKEEDIVHRMVKLAKAPKKILVLNKQDLERPYIDEFRAWEKDFDLTFDISALQHKNVKPLIDAIFMLLPMGEPLYPEDRLTNVDNRFWVQEVIREKVFLHLHEEIPYSTSVEVEDIVKRANGVTYIQAAIVTTSSRYRKMIIGARGEKIKHIGMAARKEMELVTGEKVFLELEVRVDERWQERFE